LETKEATLMRIRKDRHAPNSMETFLSIIESIKQKIKIESCLSRKGVYIMRALHNDVKKKILSTYSGMLFDVGSGRGGDLGKWKHFEKIVCVDPETSIFRERLSKCSYREKVEIHEMNISQLELTIKDGKRYSLMSCFFCLNMFSDDEVNAFIEQSDQCNNVVIIAMELNETNPVFTKQYSLKPVSKNEYIIDIPGTFVKRVKERNIDLSLIVSRLKEKEFYTKEDSRLTMDFMKTFLSLETHPFISEEEKLLSSFFRFILLTR
jgi:hypothetical protein